MGAGPDLPAEEVDESWPARVRRDAAPRPYRALAIVQRDRARERVDTLESQRERAVRQRDTARQRAERLRDRLTKKRERLTALRRELHAERARPWARLRQAVGDGAT